MTELNPEHLVTKAAHGNWHKIAAIMLHKLKLTGITITKQDLETFPDNIAIGIDGKEDHFRIFLMDTQTAIRLAQGEN